ncbi:MAG: aminotransferase class V-fold PLP-dependent enzyme [Clostridiales bacterium]|nr:MAG: aminotransferase class V-fold PLP-dependent enzyme [Clostridiales bacterium]
MEKGAQIHCKKMINASAEEIYFTSGGTESDNIAMLGYALKNRKRGNKNHHNKKPSTLPFLECCKHLESVGF